MPSLRTWLCLALSSLALSSYVTAVTAVTEVTAADSPGLDRVRTRGTCVFAIASVALPLYDSPPKHPDSAPSRMVSTFDALGRASLSVDSVMTPWMSVVLTTLDFTVPTKLTRLQDAVNVVSTSMTTASFAEGVVISPLVTDISYFLISCPITSSIDTTMTAVRALLTRRSSPVRMLVTNFASTTDLYSTATARLSPGFLNTYGRSHTTLMSALTQYDLFASAAVPNLMITDRTLQTVCTGTELPDVVAASAPSPSEDCLASRKTSQECRDLTALLYTVDRDFLPRTDTSPSTVPASANAVDTTIGSSLSRTVLATCYDQTRYHTLRRTFLRSAPGAPGAPGAAGAQ